MSKIKFGTDGWRAVISEDFTFENVKIVAQAIADFIKSEKKPIYKKRKVAVLCGTNSSEIFARRSAIC